MEKLTASSPTLQAEHSSLLTENQISESQGQAQTEENTSLKGPVIPALATTMMPVPCLLEHLNQFHVHPDNLSELLAQVTTYLTALKPSNPAENTQIKYFIDYISQQVKKCEALPGSDQSISQKQYENLLLEFPEVFAEHTGHERGPLLNAEMDKGDGSLQQVLAPNIKCREAILSDPLQEGLADPIQEEVSASETMENLPDLITQCMQLERKRSNRPELLQSGVQIPSLDSPLHPYISTLTGPPAKKASVQLRGGQLPLTPAKRARQQETKLCLYCSQPNHFTKDCLAKRSRAPARTGKPTHQ
ncbi:retrotransposon Gag-like protein 4 [Tenrec ecaudatus]|uniref:retrotransposon Gag-like protein 4 n=1 Tax=Tenrec ecaudatus TaxID=94439 RepID=UPI003F592B45